MSSVQPVFRPINYQPISTVAVTIGTTPTQLQTIRNQSDYITSFVISLDAAAANNVFIGDQGVSLTSGIEIVAGGGPVNFKIDDERMLYELMWPLLKMQMVLACDNPEPFPIPITVWDMTQWYGIAAAATNVRLQLFRLQFV